MPAPGTAGPTFGDPGVSDEDAAQQQLRALSGVGEVLTDFEIMDYLATHGTVGDQDVAAAVWEKYGGNPDGSVDRTKVGRRREDQQVSPQMAESEMQRTEDRRWERLPAGKTIGDVTSLAELSGLVKSFEFGLLQQHKAAQAPPPGGGGMPPMM